MGKICVGCGKQVKSILAPYVDGNFYLCDDCHKIYKEKVQAYGFREMPRTWEFSVEEMREVLSENGVPILERHKQAQDEKQGQAQNRKEIGRQGKVCCVCGEKDCSGGEFLQDGYRLCERCASNYAMTVAGAEVSAEFFASHSQEFFKEELSKCYNPHPHISFNFKTQKIYLKNTLSKKNYKVVNFSDLIGYSAETKEDIATADKRLFRTLDADFRFNGTTIHFHIDDSPSMNKHQEFDKVLNYFGRIQDSSNSLNSSEKPVSVSSTKDRVKPFQFSCPKCGGTNCTPIVETSTSGKDFSAGKGCCGFALLGPIGILCGSCGKGKQTKSTTYWMCPNCGNKFQK